MALDGYSDDNGFRYGRSEQGKAQVRQPVLEFGAEREFSFHVGLVVIDLENERKVWKYYMLAGWNVKQVGELIFASASV